MKSRLPESTDSILSNLERQLAPQGLVKMFLEKEENARNEESKTGKRKLNNPYWVDKESRTFFTVFQICQESLIKRKVY